MLFLNSRLFLLAIVFLTLALYLGPFGQYGPSVALPTFDNLDSKIVLYKILAESGMLFAPSSSIVPNMMDGLPRLSYGSELNALVWLFVFFKPFTAYVMNEVIMHLTAFVSMLVLLRHYFVPHTIRSRRIIVLSSSLLFALTPFWFSGGLSVPAMPLVLYAFLRIRDGQGRWQAWAVLLLVPFYSNLILVYSFFLTAMALWAVADRIVYRSFNRPFVGAIVLMGIVYLGVEYRLVISMFFDDTFISHRTEFVKYYGTFTEAFRSAHLLFLGGEEHTAIRLSPYVIGTVMIAMLLSFKSSDFSRKDSLFVIVVILLGFFSGLWNTALAQKMTLPVIFFVSLIGFFLQKGIFRVLFAMMLVQIAFAYEYAFWFYEGMHDLARQFPFIEMFNMSRFYFMAIPLWIVMLAISFSLLVSKLKYAEILIGFVVVMQVATLFDVRTFVGKDPYHAKVGFEQYYAPELFEDVAYTVGKPKDSYRVVSLGIHPLVALYNGFYTLDGYCTNYPLSYKYRFRPVIADNLSRYPGNRKMYDDWGSKCYLYAGNIGYIRYFPGVVLKGVEINVDYLKAMGGEYVLSGYEIDGAADIGLKFIKVFTSGKAYWDVYLYEIVGTAGKGGEKVE